MDLNSTLGPDERRFIDEIAALFQPWGMARSLARLFGYLLLQDAPIGLEKIAADLELSRSGAWSAAKRLEHFGHIRSYGEPGSKRELYAQSDNFAAPMIGQTRLLRDIGKQLEIGAAITAGEAAADKLRRRAAFYSRLQKIFSDAIKELEELMAEEA